MAAHREESHVSSARQSFRRRLFPTFFRTNTRPSSKKGKLAGNTNSEPKLTASLVTTNLASDIVGGQAPSSQPFHLSDASPNTSLLMPPTPQVDTMAKDKERDNEQGSLNNTLIGTHRRVPFYRRQVNKSSASEGALSSSTGHSILKPISHRSREKPSLLSRVMNRVVPCVGDPFSSDKSSAAPPVDIGSVGSEPRSSSAQPATKEPEIVGQASEKTTATDIDIPASISLPVNIETPSDSIEADVIIPPPISSHVLPPDETDGLTSGAVQPPGSTGEAAVKVTHVHDPAVDADQATFTTDTEDDRRTMDELAEEANLIRSGGSGIPIGPDGVPQPLLPPISPEHAGRKCLVLDLDETLVHSSFRAVQQADFIVPVEIEYHWHHFHVLKRPGVDEFLRKMGEMYEVVVFTASLSKYADPVLDKLDIHQVVAHRLFRESCFNHRGNYVKDLSQLGRPIADTIILDNSPASFIFHPKNAVPVSSWFNDPHDAELTDLIPFLADLTSVPDVRSILDSSMS